ncbi:MAG: hypothetical protein HGB12_01545 [Bacteroidetes bacterium]|nr:hypothetical protein [Bacteroidota bacterium]
MIVKKTLKVKKVIGMIVFSLLTFHFSLFTFNLFSQGVAINTTGSASDNSAMLDVQSDTTLVNSSQGLLIPRMSTAKRNSIISPAESLLIFNTTTKCFEDYVNGVWQTIACNCTSSPAAAGTISGTATVCPGQNAVLYNVPAIARATSYTWTYSGTGAFIVGSTNAIIVYFSGTATSGNLTVIGTNACGNGTVSADYAIAVNSTAPNITGQPVSVNTCLGGGAVSYTVTASGGLTYQWQEFGISWNNVANAGVYSNVNTATLTITNPPAGLNAYKYRCVVSGACTSSISDGLATLTVNPIPSVTNSATSTICSGTSPNLTLTSSVPSNFEWTIGTITGGITGADAGSGATINQTLTNPNTTTGSVQYIVTPTSSTGSCVGAAFTITITVNPLPTVDQPSNQTINNSSSTTAVNFSGTLSGTTYSWTNNNTSIGLAASGTGNISAFTATNSGLCAVTATITVTPSHTNDGVNCTGATKNFTIVVRATNNSCTVTNNCTASTDGNYTINKFTVVGSTTWAVPCGVSAVEYLVVAGGGGGGSTYGGGGGAGGLLTSTNFAVTGTINVTVGNGGAAQTNGGNSVFSTITAIGGGHSGIGSAVNGSTGGSGGGGSGRSGGGEVVSSGGAGTVNQGYAGGGGGSFGAIDGGGGGGGAGSVGETVDNRSDAGDGGIGISSSITGTPTYYAGGGAGCGYGTGVPVGGNGGGGNANVAGAANTGGGGGGSQTSGKQGGSGVVIIRYLIP